MTAHIGIDPPYSHYRKAQIHQRVPRPVIRRDLALHARMPKSPRAFRRSQQQRTRLGLVIVSFDAQQLS